MHICFISNEYPKEGFPHGGVGSFLKTFAPKLAALGHKVSVVGINYTTTDETTIEDGVVIYRLKKKIKKGLTWYLHSKSISEKIKYIHGQNPIDVVETAELGLAFLPKLKGIKYVIRLHGGHHFFAESENRGINWWKGFQEKRSFSKADAFIAVSDYVLKHTAKYLDFAGRPIKVIFIPIDINRLQPNNNFQPERNNITFVGTVCEKKGVRQLVQAFNIVKSKFPEARLNLYGRDWHYADGSSYMEMLKNEELPKIVPFDKDVVFHGSINHAAIPKAYACAEVCVFPSHMETLGLVAPEAMAMGKPVVFTKLGPGPEVINNGVTGLLVNPYLPEEIAKAIISLLEDEKKADEMGKNARVSVLRQFNPSVIISENINWYQ